MDVDDKAMVVVAGGFIVGVLAGMGALFLGYRANREALIRGTRDRIVSASLQSIPAEYGELAQALRVPGVATFVADQVAATMREKLP